MADSNDSSIPTRSPSPSRYNESISSQTSKSLYYSTSSRTTVISKNEILENAYIYIIYPSNYNDCDIDTRLFYIGSTCDDFEKKKKEHYDELYNNSNTSKKYKIMKQYMQNCYDCYNDTILEKDKNKDENEKLWQIKIIFHGINCCTPSYLETLQGLYIHYYYSIMNDREITSFRFNDITEYQINYFNYLNLDKVLKNGNFSYDKQYSYYNIRPYNFINKTNISLSINRHIYKELCDQPFIPKFNSIEDLTRVIIVSKDIEEFNNEFIKKSVIIPNEEIQEKVIYINKTKDDKHKCIHCNKKYKFINNRFVEHFKEKHNIIITVDDLLNNSYN
jgi:hypothetical protein